MPSEYRANDISFAYPDNWCLEENEMSDGNMTVHLTSPGGAFWMVTISDSQTTPEKLSQNALNAILSEYDRVEHTPVNRIIGSYRLVGHEMNFIYLDLFNTALILCFTAKGKTFAVYWQSDDEQLDTYADVFEAITFTLLDRMSS
jgi:predicted NUDIX family NTP pyrophosphohydrolase